MGVNKVMLLGRLGSDPELRYTPNSNPVCSFRLATTERRKGQDGQYQDITEWHSVVVWGKAAENCKQYLAKGREAFIEGRIQTRKWQDNQGNDRYRTEIIASVVQFVGGKGDASMQMTPQNNMNKNTDSTNAQTGADVSFEDEVVSFNDDDIPF